MSCQVYGPMAIAMNYATHVFHPNFHVLCCGSGQFTIVAKMKKRCTFQVVDHLNRLQGGV